MNKIKVFILLFCFYTSICTGQIKQDIGIQRKIVALKKLLTKADTLHREDDPAIINVNIAKLLTEILREPSIKKYNLDALLKHPFLTIVHSTDKSLYFFYWYSNNGGTWSINNHLIYYRKKMFPPNIYISLDDIDIENQESNETYISNAQNSPLAANGGTFDDIYTLITHNKTLYLLQGFVKGCTTCCGEMFSVIEIKEGKLNFEYPAFYNNGESSASFSIASRCGDLLKFSFDATKQIIDYSYLTDDQTPIQTIDKQKRIVGTLRFNGEKFVTVK